MKKILLSFGALTAIVAPVITVVSCNEESGNEFRTYNFANKTSQNPNGDIVTSNDHLQDFGIGFEWNGDRLISISIYYEDGHQVAGHESNSTDPWVNEKGRPLPKTQAAIIKAFEVTRKDVCGNASDSENYVRAISIEFGGTPYNGTTNIPDSANWSMQPSENSGAVVSSGNDIKEFGLTPVFVLPYSKA